MCSSLDGDRKCTFTDLENTLFFTYCEISNIFNGQNTFQQSSGEYIYERF